jgi:hypothetical protein
MSEHDSLAMRNKTSGVLTIWFIKGRVIAQFNKLHATERKINNNGNYIS